MGHATQTLGALPPEPTPLVGRERDLERVLDLLGRDEVRLLTLTGAGGVGKTRLASRAAALAGEGYADGVLFVRLESIRDPGLVPSALAQHLGLSDVGERSRLDEVLQHLAVREMLLVLDGFEHLLEGAPALGELLSACERVKVMVTSRAILRLSGEQEFPVRPLPVPPRDGDASPAVTLFVQRATAVDPDFRLSPEGHAAVASICSRLDGLPLAIELAAARVRLMRPEAMLTRLSRRFELLTGGPRDAPARHQTMRDTVAWSYGLLEPDERQAFRLLSVFPGGCSLEAAEGVADAVGAGAGLLETLASLMDKSMLVRLEAAGGEARIGMLETLRAFAHDELVATGELAEAQDAHAAWCLALAAEAELATTGPDQPAWLDRLETELPNVRAALRRLLDTGRHADALTLTCDLERLWFVRGHMSEGRRWIGEGLSEMPGHGAATARALALDATMAFYSGDAREAEALASRALAAAEGIGADAARAAALAAMGLAERATGRYAEAARHYAESTEILRRLDRPSQLAETLTRRAIVAMQAEDVHVMRRLSEEAVALARSVGDHALIAYSATPLAIAMMMAGEPGGGAAQLLDEALAAARALGNRRHASRTLWAQGRLALQRGEPALALFEESCALCREFGDGVFLNLALPSLARAEMAAGRPDVTALLLAAARATRVATGTAWIEWMHGDEGEIVAAARAALGPERFDAVWAEGSAMTPEAAFVATRGAAPAPAEPETDTPVPPEELTAREAEVLTLVARGLTDAQVAAQLVVSRRTVHAHLRAVYRKLEVSSRHAATRWAVEHGLT